MQLTIECKLCVGGGYWAGTVADVFRIGCCRAELSGPLGEDEEEEEQEEEEDDDQDSDEVSKPFG